MFPRISCWLRQRQVIKRQKVTIQQLKDALMRQPEIVRYQGVLFVRSKGGWEMYQQVGFTPEIDRRRYAQS